MQSAVQWVNIGRPGIAVWFDRRGKVGALWKTLNCTVLRIYWSSLCRWEVSNWNSRFNSELNCQKSIIPESCHIHDLIWREWEIPVRWIDVGNNSGLRYSSRLNNEFFLIVAVRSTCALASSTHYQYGHRQHERNANRDLERSLRPIHRLIVRKSLFRESTTPLDELRGSQSSSYNIAKHRLSLSFLQAWAPAGPVRLWEECLPNKIGTEC